MTVTAHGMAQLFIDGAINMCSAQSQRSIIDCFSKTEAKTYY